MIHLREWAIPEMVGELVAELDKHGIAEKTVILFGSDHGLFMGEKGIGGKGLIYDLAAKFPCFVYDPHTPANLRGVSCKEVVSSLDLTTTILDYAGVKAGAYMTGRSLKHLVRGEELKTPWRTGLFLENLYTGRDTPIQEGYVEGDWKYIRYFKAPHPYKVSDVEQTGREAVFESLFSLKEDPEERNDLSSKPGHLNRLERLRGLCDRELEKILQLRKDYSAHYISD